MVLWLAMNIFVSCLCIGLYAHITKTVKELIKIPNEEMAKKKICSAYGTNLNVISTGAILDRLLVLFDVSISMFVKLQYDCLFLK